jgi:hypothetical protein
MLVSAVLGFFVVFAIVVCIVDPHAALHVADAIGGRFGQ